MEGSEGSDTEDMMKQKKKEAKKSQKDNRDPLSILPGKKTPKGSDSVHLYETPGT
jgi:hypothetical protein